MTPERLLKILRWGVPPDAENWWRAPLLLVVFAVVLVASVLLLYQIRPTDLVIGPQGLLLESLLFTVVLAIPLGAISATVFTYLLAYVIVMLLGAKVRLLEGPPDAGSGQEAGARSLDVELSEPRRQLLQRLTTSANRIRDNVQVLPPLGIRQAAELFVHEQQRLLPEVDYTLHLAEWLDEQVADLEVRAGGASVSDKLARVRSRTSDMDQAVEQVAQTLYECEANLLATIAERDQTLLSGLFAEFARRFAVQYDVVHQLNQEMSALSPATAPTPAPPGDAKTECTSQQTASGGWS